MLGRIFLAESDPAYPPAAPRLPLAFEPLLPLPPPHHAPADGPAPALTFYFENPTGRLTLAQLHVELPTGLTLPEKPAFGFLQATPALSAAALHQLLEAAETALRERGQRRLHLRGQPFCYDPAGAAQLAEVLRQRRYPVARADLNQHLDLRQPYAATLSATAQQHLAESRRAGLHLEQEPPLLLPLAYEFMQACRQARGQEMRRSLPELQALFRQFPRAYSLFSMREPGGDWAVLTVAAQLSSSVLCAGTPVSPLRPGAPNPAPLLYEGLHAFGQASGLRVLDLGSSHLARTHDGPLLNFRRDIGGVAGLRLSWEKTLFDF